MSRVRRPRCSSRVPLSPRPPQAPPTGPPPPSGSWPVCQPFCLGSTCPCFHLPVPGEASVLEPGSPAAAVETFRAFGFLPWPLNRDQSSFPSKAHLWGWQDWGLGSRCLRRGAWQGQGSREIFFKAVDVHIHNLSRKRGKKQTK